MSREWTDHQRDAITARGGSIIVSAAAGSGKTAVLVERCIRLLTDPDPAQRVDADRLLVVTFTRAAAAEMKDRLSKAIAELIRKTRDNADLIRQQRLLQKAKICTIDSYCASLVKEYFYILDVDRNVRVADAGELNVLRADAMRLTMDSLYGEQNNVFLQIVETFASAKDDRRLEANVLKLYDFVRSHPFPERWMAEKLRYYTDFENPSDSVWGRIIRDYTVDAMDFMESLYDRGYDALSSDEKLFRANEALYAGDRAFLDRLREAVEREKWDEIRLTLGSFVGGRFSTPRGYAENPLKIAAANTRSIFKKTVEELTGIYAMDEDLCLYDIELLKGFTEQIFHAVRLFSENFDALKSERGIADYPDLEHWAVRLLVDDESLQPTPLAREIAARYDYVLVDEYQDANETQEYLYKALSHDETNLFVVGDVKQSIYAFRHAMPELFLRRKSRAALYNGTHPVFPAKIILEKNFRSEASVLEAVNFIFTKLMSPSVGDIAYNDEERLYPGAVYDPPREAPVELDIVDKLSMGEADGLIAEARCIAERIHRMVFEGFAVKDGDGYRQAQYGDFAVLLRNFNPTAPTYAEVLSQYGIPVSTESDDGFLSAREIMVMTNLLRVINNPALDIEMLSTVMCPVFAFTEDDLARIRVGKRRSSLYAAIIADAEKGNEKSRRFLDELRYYRSLSVTVPLSKLITVIYDRSSYMDVMSAIDPTAVGRDNLRMLLDYARSFEQATHRGLSAFISYLDRLTESGSDLSAAKRDQGIGESGVRLMSIHASKGLEFPVCFIANLNHRFVSSATESVLLHPRYGYAQKRVDPVLSASFNTMPRKALSIEISRAEKSEELRVLYVALTRAKQKLILCTTPRYGAASYLGGISKKLAGEREISPYVVRSASSLSDWLTMCAMLHPDGAPLREYAQMEVDCEQDAAFRFDCRVIGSIYEASEDRENVISQTEGHPADSAVMDILKRHADYRYPYEGLSGLPVKVAASTLAHRFSSAASQRYLNRPAFMGEEKLNAAEKGTALHAFMQFTDFGAAREDIPAELQRMVQAGYLTRQQADSIDLDRAKAFILSPLVTRVLNASEVYKEYRFNVKIPARIVNPQVEERFAQEEVILQGAVDLAFVEDGALVIVDYKTDRVKHPEQLRGMYAAQLELYRDALSRCLNLPVKECLIYSVRHSAAVEVYHG